MIKNLENFRVFVFKPISLDDEEYYQHYECDETSKLVPGLILSKQQHFELLNAD